MAELGCGRVTLVLMLAFGITGLAPEWDEDLTPVIEAFLAAGTLADLCARHGNSVLADQERSSTR